MKCLRFLACDGMSLLETGYATLAPENASLMTWWDFSAYADANVFILFRQDHAISSKLLVGSGGCVEKIVTPPPWFPGNTH